MKKITIKNIIAFIVGNIRYRLYYSKFLFLIRRHILEQIRFRIKVMDRECYVRGSCVMCGCTTTALQMANKMCDKPCYPPMMKKKIWNKFYSDKKVKIKEDIWYKYSKSTFSEETMILYIVKNKKIVNAKIIM